MYRYSNAAPSPTELKKALAKACHLRAISGDRQLLNAEHLKVIKTFFNAEMKGNLPGAQTVTLWKGEGKPGVRPNHLLTTGLAHRFEWITNATLQLKQSLLKRKLCRDERCRLQHHRYRPVQARWSRQQVEE